MPQRSSSGVRAWWFPKDEAWAAARAYAQELGAKHPEVEDMLAQGNFFLRRALGEGVELFRRRE